VNVPLPAASEDLTPALLTSLVCARYPSTIIDAVELLEAKSYGEDMVSTSARAVLKLHYATSNSNGLPTRVVVKMVRGVDSIMAPFYRNEVAFYRDIRDQLAIEAPRAIAAASRDVSMSAIFSQGTSSDSKSMAYLRHPLSRRPGANTAAQ
jgi:hypothetical protein